MSAPSLGPDHVVLLPSGAEWNADARLVGEAFATVAAAAAAAANNDDTRYVLPILKWQIAAEAVGDCATEDHRADHLRLLPLPQYVLDAVWACHEALVVAADGDADSSRPLVNLLGYYLPPVHSTDLAGLTGAVERVLAVLTLDLPAARLLAGRLVLGMGHTPTSGSALEEVLGAWRRLGITP